MAADSAPLGIYTGRWWWVPSTGNSADFSHLPLWHAEYPTEIPQDLPAAFTRIEPYGGWKHPAMWQYRGTTEIAGLSVDLNYLPDQAPAKPDRLQVLDLVSIGNHARMGWDLRTLHPNDKQVIRWLLEQVHGG